MALSADSIAMNQADTTPVPAALIERGQQRINLRGAVPHCLVQVDQAWASGQQALAGALLNEEALASIQQTLDTDPARVDLLYVTGKLLMNLGRHSQALPIYQRIVKLEPCAAGFYLLSELLQALGQVGESLHWAKQALAADPDHTDYMARLAYCLFYSGQIEAGVAMMRQAFDQRPTDAVLLEECVAWEHYLPERGRDSFLSSYRKLGRLLSSGIEICTRHQNAPEPNRRLRIGVISPYFRNNSVAYTFEPFLDGYEREKLKLYGYGQQRPEQGDAATERLCDKFDHFRFIWGMDTQAVFDLIQRDQVDILVEIGGYVRNHRFDVLARKPAPIQVDFGCTDTTGLAQIDYRFTDAVRDPLHWHHPYVETSVYLPGGCLCYRPIPAPAVTSGLPALRNGHITFGAFHDHLKLNASVLKLWASILERMADARLIIKCGGAADQDVRGALWERCHQAGLDVGRVELLDWLPHSQHLSLYDRVDLLLDAFPFNGAIMTLEGLWMGVPTVSLTGELWLTRTGHLILSELGLEAFVADTPEAYVEKAIAFSQQWDALARIRAGLRQTMLASSLCNPHRFASELTMAFRYMWFRWCRTQGVRVPHTEPPGLFVPGSDPLS